MEHTTLIQISNLGSMHAYLLINFSSQTQVFCLLLLLLLLIYGCNMFRPTSGHHQVHNTKTRRRCNGSSQIIIIIKRKVVFDWKNWSFYATERDRTFENSYILMRSANGASVKGGAFYRNSSCRCEYFMFKILCAVWRRMPILCIKRRSYAARWLGEATSVCCLLSYSLVWNAYLCRGKLQNV
jgi:hypothetical protein